MTFYPALVTLIFLAICTVLLLVPFAPAWDEWRRPSDFTALPVPVAYSSQADHFAQEMNQRVVASMTEYGPAGVVRAQDLLYAQGGQLPTPMYREEPPISLAEPVVCTSPVYAAGDFQACAGSSFTVLHAAGGLDVGAGSVVTEWVHADKMLRLGEATVGLRRITSKEAVKLERGCCFERLNAPFVYFGTAGADRPAVANAPAQPRELSGLPGLRRWSETLYRCDGNCALPPDGHYKGSLVVTGTLVIGAGAVIEGDVKARTGILVAPGARVLGSLMSEGAIHLLKSCAVHGPVVSEKTVLVSFGVRVGRPEAPTTMSAPTIIVETGAIAHGSVWARQTGVVWDATS